VCQVRRAGRAGGYLLPVWIRAAAWSAVLWIRQAGGVIRCSLCSRSATSAADQGGVLVPDVLRIRQGGGRESGKKEAGRARRVWRVPACCAVCCCDLPAPAPLHGMPPGCFSRFPGAVLCAAPEGSDSPLYRVVLYV